MVRERELKSISGIFPAILILAAFILVGVEFSRNPSPEIVLGLVVIVVLNGLAAKGLFIVNPNEGKVAQFFGELSKTNCINWRMNRTFLPRKKRKSSKL